MFVTFHSKFPFWSLPLWFSHLSWILLSFNFILRLAVTPPPPQGGLWVLEFIVFRCFIWLFLVLALALYSKCNAVLQPRQNQCTYYILFTVCIMYLWISYSFGSVIAVSLSYCVAYQPETIPSGDPRGQARQTGRSSGFLSHTDPIILDSFTLHLMRHYSYSNSVNS
jgi:hypothetical protein